MISRRSVGYMFVICGLAGISLLALHPAGEGHTLIEFIDNETRNQTRGGLAHGGYLAELSVLLVAFYFLRSHLRHKTITAVGFIYVSLGTGVMIAAVLIDGFTTPAISARFVHIVATDDLLIARTMLGLCGEFTRSLMDLAVAFQSTAILSWSVAAFQEGAAMRPAGLMGLVVGAASLIALIAFIAAPALFMQHILLGIFLAQALWHVLLGALLLRPTVTVHEPGVL